tara:strand:- start:258 stop:572 length:315 start_codon:yes stop_codon:yes gene_type:complete
MRKSKINQEKRELLNKLDTRFKTVMIGSLARIEDHLGFLWGHDKDQELTEQQKKYEIIWDDLRNEILNHGNYNLREGLEDVEEFFDRADKYSYQFIMNNRRNYE